MAINFPATPSTNQTYTFNGRTWTWNGVGWQATGSTGLTVYTKTDFTATAGQTSFSCTYTVGFVDVYYNGSKLSTSEYTATTGSTVVLGTACALGDIVETIAWTISSSFNPSLGSASATSLAIGGATIGTNALAVTGTTALSGLLTAAGGVSSTLTTDATSSTTGSIITAGGISCQKAAVVGTLLGIGMAPTNVLDITKNQNATSTISLLNNQAGGGANASVNLSNGTNNASLYMLSQGFGSSGPFQAGYTVLSSSSGIGINASSGYPILFGINSAEVARIGTDGSFLVGTTTNAGAGKIYSSGGLQQQRNISISFVNNPGNTSVNARCFARWLNSADQILFGDSDVGYPPATYQFNTAGGVGVLLNNGATAWTSASDETMKTDLVPIQSGAEKVTSLRAMTGRYKTDKEGISRSFLIAQDVQKVLPEAVTAGDDGMLGLRYTEVVPLLVAAIQELTTRLAALESK